jgi:predicted nucleic acid-binding protein
MDAYILEACALIALIMDEAGSDTVSNVINSAYKGETDVFLNKLNLLEVYYGDYRAHGKTAADTMLGKVKKLPISIKDAIGDAVFLEAGRLKATYKISIADAVALAETSISEGTLVTADHHEMDIIDKNEKIRFLWIR